MKGPASFSAPKQRGPMAEAYSSCRRWWLAYKLKIIGTVAYGHVMFMDAYTMQRDNTGHRRYFWAAILQPQALLSALTVFLTWSLLDFLATITTNRSKSFNDRLASIAARFVAHEDFVHFSTIPSASSCLRMTPVPAARGSLASLKGVRVRCRYGKE